MIPNQPGGYVSLDPVNPHDVRLYHKSTHRGIYERALLEAEDADEVVLWNERGEVTECYTANLVIAKNVGLVTPPVTCGLLPGSYREFLLRRGSIKEEWINKGELTSATRVFLVNAVQKWRKATLLPD